MEDKGQREKAVSLSESSRGSSGSSTSEERSEAGAKGAAPQSSEDKSKDGQYYRGGKK